MLALKGKLRRLSIVGTTGGALSGTTHQASVRKIRRITQVTRNILQNEARGGVRPKTDGPRETTTVITQAISRKLNVSKAKLIMVSITGKKLARLNSR